MGGKGGRKGRCNVQAPSPDQLEGRSHPTCTFTRTCACVYAWGGCVHGASRVTGHRTMAWCTWEVVDGVLCWFIMGRGWVGCGVPDPWTTENVHSDPCFELQTVKKGPAGVRSTGSLAPSTQLEKCWRTMEGFGVHSFVSRNTPSNCPFSGL